MTQYAIVTFPKTVALDSIESIRRELDPQSKLLGAHITLVFPFRSHMLEADLRSHVEASVAGVPPFEVRITGTRTKNQEYVFLDLHGGPNPLIELHDRLYRGPLAEHLSREHTYRPHITVARVTDDPARLAAAERRVALIPPTTAMVTEVAAFRLDGEGHGAVAFTVPLSAAVRR